MSGRRQDSVRPCPARRRRPTSIPRGTRCAGPSCATTSSWRTSMPSRRRRRSPAPARPRVARDDAHLVAQHRRARGGGLRGHRARPARVRRSRPSPATAATTSRRTRATSTRSSTTCSGTSAAWRAAATSAAASSSTSGCASPASSSGRSCSTASCRSCPRRTPRPASSRSRRGGAAGRGRLLPAPGPRRRRARRRAGDTPEQRRRYVEQFYGSRFWATPGAFSREAPRSWREPFEDADRLRASFGNYESALGRDPAERAAAVLRALPGADGRALRTGRPRHVPRLLRAAARSRSRTSSARSSSRAPGTSSSGSGPTC